MGEISLQQCLLLKIPQRAPWEIAFPSHITQGSAPLGFSVGLSMESSGMESLHASPVIVATALGPGYTLGAQSIKRNDEVGGTL